MLGRMLKQNRPIQLQTRNSCEKHNEKKRSTTTTCYKIRHIIRDHVLEAESGKEKDAGKSRLDSQITWHEIQWNEKGGREKREMESDKNKSQDDNLKMMTTPKQHKNRVECMYFILCIVPKILEKLF